MTGVAFKPVTTVVGAGQNTIYQAVPATTARWFRIAVPKDATVHDLALGHKLEVERMARMAAKRGITNPLGVTAHPPDRSGQFRQARPGGAAR